MAHLLPHLSQLLIRRDDQLSYEDCTLSTCDLKYAQVSYVPSLGGNAFYVALFGLLLLLQFFLGLRYRTWGFWVGTVAGIALETVGYGARISMHYNPFPQNPFLIQIITLTIAPAFICAAIYLCLARIVVVYGEDISRLKPRTYSIMFVTFDFFSLVLQGLGGGIASTADTYTSRKRGVDIMIGGLSLQVVSLILFMILCLDFAWRVRRHRGGLNPVHASLRRTLLWKAFLLALTLATLTIFVRSVFRVAELSEGFDGSLANDEVTFMILEGAMIAVACICLTALHPGIALQGSYKEANFTLRGRRGPQTTITPTRTGEYTPDEEMQGFKR
ncbi:MAG: hypothetical protein M1816_000096 [Peltula sp. TS41687]|nr:MAG: hypothetical protein M1816_000096 [Peltula sp. TS41687]